MSRSDGSRQVLVVIPALNEAEHIKGVVEQICSDDYPKQVWVMDGGSSDGTQEVVKRLERPNVAVYCNPNRTQANAVNLAADMARKDGGYSILVRVDAHAKYPAEFVRRLVETLDENGADSVVVPMVTEGYGPMQEAAACLFNSWLGNGGSPHRAGGARGWVEHGHHAAFLLDRFLDVGGYDVRFEANEDAEFDRRLISSGGRIFLDSNLAIGYFPRGSLGGSWRQMFRNGRFRVYTAVKHRSALGVRQVLPISVVPFLCGSLVCALLLHPLFLVAGLSYLLAVLLLAAKAASVKGVGDVCRWYRVMALAVVSHGAFSCGALTGAWQLYVRPGAGLRKELRSKWNLNGN